MQNRTKMRTISLICRTSTLSALITLVVNIPCFGISFQLQDEINAYNRGDYQETINIGRQITTQIPHNETAHYYLANAYLKSDQPQLAQQEYSYCFQTTEDPKIRDYSALAMRRLTNVQFRPSTNQSGYSSDIPNLAQMRAEVQQARGRIVQQGVNGINDAVRIGRMQISKIKENANDDLATFLGYYPDGLLYHNDKYHPFDRYFYKNDSLDYGLHTITANYFYPTVGGRDGRGKDGKDGKDGAGGLGAPTIPQIMRKTADANIQTVLSNSSIQNKQITTATWKTINALDSTASGLISQLKSPTGNIELSSLGLDLYVRNYINYDDATSLPPPVVTGLKATEKTINWKKSSTD